MESVLVLVCVTRQVHVAPLQHGSTTHPCTRTAQHNQSALHSWKLPRQQAVDKRSMHECTYARPRRGRFICCQDGRRKGAPKGPQELQGHEGLRACTSVATKTCRVTGTPQMQCKLAAPSRCHAAAAAVADAATSRVPSTEWRRWSLVCWAPCVVRRSWQRRSRALRACAMHRALPHARPALCMHARPPHAAPVIAFMQACIRRL